MKRSLFITTWLYIIFLPALNFLFAQGITINPPKVIGPSPEAANLGRYGEIPVSLNSGTVNVSVPIYNIEYKDLKVPISLSYHPSIKVSDIASWTGLGFALNSGGVITRSVNGQPDESTNGYFNKWAQWQTHKDVVGYPKLGVYDAAYHKHQFQFKAATGEYDLHADVFYFNFGSYTGRIRFSADKKPIITPYTDLKISEDPFNGASGGWTITTPEGVQYVFKAQDAETTRYITGGDPFKSSWYLSQIRSASHPEVITFVYEEATILGAQEGAIENARLLKVIQNPNCNADPPVFEGESYAEISIKTKFLKFIYFPNGYVQFLSNTDRADVYPVVNYPHRKLTDINVIALDNSLIHSFNFTYSYFGEGAARRLRLDAVGESGKPPYKFQYNAETLPALPSYAQDHWGYYNGANTNISLIQAPTASEKTGYRDNPLASANRKSNPLTMSACLLERLTYPTGGYTTMSYEPNKVFMGSETGQVRVETQAIATANKSASFPMDANEQSMYNYLMARDDQRLGPPRVEATIFTPPFAQTITLTKTIENYSGGAVGAYADTYLYRYDNMNYDFPICQNCASTANLEAGVPYIIFAVVSQANVTVTIKANYTNLVDGSNVNIHETVGGMRIASMEDHDGINEANTIVKNYNYNDANDRSTAALFTYYNYSTTLPCGDKILSASNVNELGTMEGGHIGYGQVTVTQVKDAETSKSIYRYNNSSDDIIRGQLLEETHFEGNKKIKSIVNTYLPREQSIFNANVPSIKMKFTEHHIVGGNLITADYYKFNIQSFINGTYWVYLTESREKLYDKNDNTKYTERVTTYNMGKEVTGDPLRSHTLPKEKTEIDSKGRTITTSYTYPIDYNDAVFQQMQSKYIKSSPVEQVVKVNNQITGGSITTYKTGTYNLPDKIYSFESANPINASGFTYSQATGSFVMDTRYRERASFYYDNKGNIIRYLQDNLSNAYIWGYTSRLPIAEVTNAEPGRIAYTSFENPNEGGWAYGSITRGSSKTGDFYYDFASGSITLSNLPIGDYIISYLSKDGLISTSLSAGTVVYDAASQADFESWVYKEGKINVTSSTNSLTLSGTGKIDELRIYPQGALMKTYSYLPLVGISSMTDENNSTTYYNYNGLKQLALVKDSNKDIVKKIDYHYSKENYKALSPVINGNFTVNAGSTNTYGVTINNELGQLRDVTYKWYINSNTILSTGTSVTITAGCSNFSLTVIVTDFFGNQFTASRTISPISHFAATIDGPASVNPNTIGLFTVNATGGCGSVKYAWFQEVMRLGGLRKESLMTSTPTISFQAACSTFVLICEVTDNNETLEIRKSVTITDVGITASISSEFVGNTAGQTNTFTATASSPCGNILGYNWVVTSPGNPIKSINGNRISITPDCNNYTVMCTISDSKGHTITISKYIIVSPPGDLRIALTRNPAGTINSGERVNFYTTPSNACAPLTYKWYRMRRTESQWQELTHTTSNTLAMWGESGNYSIMVEVTDSKGRTVSPTINVTVNSSGGGGGGGGGGPQEP